MDKEYRLRISLEEGQLWVHQKWDGLEYPLIPSGELLFFVMDDNAGFEFERDETGRVTGFLVMGQYRFAKQ